MKNAISYKEVKRSTLEVKEVATYLGVSGDTIYQLVREGQIPCFRIGRRILFRRERIDRWIDEQME